jgi:hypothetical protein
LRGISTQYRFKTRIERARSIQEASGHDSIVDAMLQALNAPKDDRFQVITEHPAEDFISVLRDPRTASSFS